MAVEIGDRQSGQSRHRLLRRLHHLDHPPAPSYKKFDHNGRRQWTIIAPVNDFPALSSSPREACADASDCHYYYDIFSLDSVDPAEGELVNFDSKPYGDDELGFHGSTFRPYYGKSICVVPLFVGLN